MTYERTTGTQRVVQKRGPWTPKEDELLRNTVEKLGERNWKEIAKKIPGRTTKQCYDRWNTCLNPNLNKEPWTPEEDRIIIKEQKKLGNQWTKIALLLPGRSSYMVKNRWYTVLQQKQTEKQNPQVQPNKKPLRRACYLPEALQNPQGQPTIHQQPLQNPQKTQLPKITEISDSLHIAIEDIDTFLRNINKQHQQRES